MNKGKLIVLEGIDGSGKTTQVDLLKKYLDSKKISWESVSFPQYGKNKYAKKIYDYLSGKLGKMDPDNLAKLYADDRQTVKEKIINWLNDGKLVIANRYTSSNIAHLGIDLKEDMPKPFLTILLDVDPAVGQKNSQEKNHPDLHEDDLNHLREARKIFLELSKEKKWVVVECMEGNLSAGRQEKMKSPREINREIVKLLQDMILSRL